MKIQESSRARPRRCSASCREACIPTCGGSRRERTVEIDLPGYAIGGLSVGEPRPMTYEMVDAAMPYLPENKPRYLMGVGTPEEIVHYVAQGVDMMDCVLPTRAARHGLLFTSEGKLTIKNARFAQDEGPIDPEVRLQGVRALFAGVSAAPVRV